MTTTDKASSRDQSRAQPSAWAIERLSDGRLLASTVADTQRAAKVNWLVAEGRVVVTNAWSDERIEGEFVQRATGIAALVEVSILRHAPIADRRYALLAMEIADGKLVISIGVEALAHAIARSPALHGSKVTNADAFAQDLLDRLSDGDDETGLNLIQHALDDAAEQAAEQGSKNIVCPGDAR